MRSKPMEMFKLSESRKEIVQKVELISKAGIYPEDRLERCMELILRTQNGKKIEDTDIEWLKNDFDKYGFDDIYRIEMFFATTYSNMDTLDLAKQDVKEFFIQLYIKTSKEENTDDKTILSKAQDYFVEIGKAKTENLVPRIRNRLILLEVLTYASPDHLIPKLLEVCPRYLSSPVIAKKISKWAYGLKCGNKTDKNKFNSVISSLKRKPEGSRRIYKYWTVVSKYHKYKKHFTDLKRKGEIHDSPSSKAISKLINENLVGSKRNFDNIYAEINVLVKKHSEVGDDEDILSYGWLFESMRDLDSSIFYCPSYWWAIFD